MAENAAAALQEQECKQHPTHHCLAVKPALMQKDSQSRPKGACGLPYQRLSESQDLRNEAIIIEYLRGEKRCFCKVQSSL